MFNVSVLAAVLELKFVIGGGWNDLFFEGDFSIVKF